MIRLRILLLVLGVIPAFGTQQSIQVTSSAAGVALPNTAPWTTIGANTSPMRWEMRIHDFGSDWPGYPQWLVDLGPVRLSNAGSNHVQAGSEYVSGRDGVYNNGPIIGNCCTGRTDVLVRVQRDVANTRYTMEVCDTTGGNCQSATAVITGYGGASWVGITMRVAAGGNVGFLRWFSSVVPIGTQIPAVGVVGDLGDWEFDGNLLDSSGHGLNLSGGSVSYVATPVYPPACNPGTQRSFRAGRPTQLDGSGSYPLNGGTFLSYVWQLTSGPAGLSWSSHGTARPQIRGLVFGSYVFQLTVTDSSNQSSVCTIKDGAVATDSNDIVITNNSAVDTLLGPMVRWGANPWPWYDNRHKAAADTQIAEMDVQFPAWWDTPGPGTVSVTKGSSSQTVVGSGTTFTTTFCKGPSDPTHHQDGYPVISIWYPLNGGTGHSIAHVQSCTDDTHLTTDYGWGGSPGMGYTYAADNYYSSIWGFGSTGTPANYYDNVAAYYALYYRSGIDDYLSAARTFADRWWENPMVNQGYASPGYGFGGRSSSIMGLVLRALDGRSEMWTGLRQLWTNYMGALAGPDVEYGLWDTREMAYHLAVVSYCALFDPDTTTGGYRSRCKTAIVNSFPATWTPDIRDGIWPQVYTSTSSRSTSSSVTMTNGSSTAVGVGTTGWATAAPPFPQRMWFTNDPTNTPQNSDGDPVTYTATYVDPTHLTLDRPYEGTSGTHGWYLTSEGSALGWTSQPFMTGLLGAAFDLAAKAVADVSPTTAALAHSYDVAVANWIRDYAYRPATKGVWYFVGGPDCTPPLTESNIYCTGNLDNAGSRTLSAEAIRGVMFAYAYNHDPSLKTLGDELYNAMWAKPATCPSESTLCVPDGSYLSGMDDGGYMISGGPPVDLATPWKWLGMFFGFSAQSAWAGQRVGGLQSAIGERVYIGANLPGVPGATKMRVVITDPSGSTTTTDCNALPCAVTVDSRQGDSLVSIQYLSATGAVLASSRTPLIGGQ